MVEQMTHYNLPTVGGTLRRTAASSTLSDPRKTAFTANNNSNPTNPASNNTAPHNTNAGNPGAGKDNATNPATTKTPLTTPNHIVNSLAERTDPLTTHIQSLDQAPKLGTQTMPTLSLHTATGAQFTTKVPGWCPVFSPLGTRNKPYKQRPTRHGCPVVPSFYHLPALGQKKKTKNMYKRIEAKTRHHQAPALTHCPHCNQPTLTITHDWVTGLRTFPAKKRIDPTPLTLDQQLGCILAGRELWAITQETFTYEVAAARVDRDALSRFEFWTGRGELGHHFLYPPVILPAHRCSGARFPGRFELVTRPLVAALPEEAPF